MGYPILSAVNKVPPKDSIQIGILQQTAPLNRADTIAICDVDTKYSIYYKVRP